MNEFDDYDDYEEYTNFDITANNFMQEIPASVTRLEIMDANGKSYSNYDGDRITLSFEDNGLTLRIFVDQIDDNHCPY